MSDETKPNVLLVDLSGLFWRSWMSQGDTLMAKDNTLALVRRCMEGGGFAAPVALCLDRGRSFRKDIAESYKASRPEKDLQALDELRRTEQVLADEGFTMWGAPGFEADDIIATAARQAVERGHTVTVASADKDLLQLLDIPGVTVLRTHNFRVWNHPDVMVEYGVDAATLGDWLALVGDKSDNIRGCPGVGDKTATKLLAEHGTLEAVLRAAAAGDVKNSVGRSLVQYADDIRRDRRLVALAFDAPIDFEEIYRPRERKRAAAVNANPGEELNMPNELSHGNELSGAPPPQVQTELPVGTPQVPSEPAPPPAPVAPAAPTTVAAPAAPPKVETKAIATAPAVIVPEVFASFELALEPRDAVQALSLAKVFWRSGLYGRFPSEEALYVVITRGRELGVPAAAALDCFHFFEGRIALHAHFIRHLAQQDPDCEWFAPWAQEGDDPAKIARWATKHRRIERPIIHTYTIQQAVDAGLCELEVKPRIWTPLDRDGKPPKDSRGNWDKRRAEMLDKQCSTALARKVYPGRALGLYSLSELGGDEDGA